MKPKFKPKSPVDSIIIDMIIEDHLANDSDYTSNTLTPTFPDGQDVEVFTFQVLEKAWKRANAARLGLLISRLMLSL